MTLDEAIRHCEEVAEENENCYERWSIHHPKVGKEQTCLECAAEHRQLAEWLKELKAYREAREEIIRKRDSSQWSELVVHGFSHAIYTIDNHLKEVNADEDSD